MELKSGVLACQESSGECVGAARVVRDAFWGEKQERMAGNSNRKNCIWGSPILGRIWPSAARGGIGGILPHSRDKIGSFAPRGGFGGDPQVQNQPDSTSASDPPLPRGFEDATSTPGAGGRGLGVERLL